MGSEPPRPERRARSLPWPACLRALWPSCLPALAAWRPAWARPRPTSASTSRRRSSAWRRPRASMSFATSWASLRVRRPRLTASSRVSWIDSKVTTTPRVSRSRSACSPACARSCVRSWALVAARLGVLAAGVRAREADRVLRADDERPPDEPAFDPLDPLFDRRRGASPEPDDEDDSGCGMMFSLRCRRVTRRRGDVLPGHQPLEQRLLRVASVFRLVPDGLARPVENGGCDLLADR